MTMEEYKMSGGVVPDTSTTKPSEEEEVDLDAVIEEFNDDDGFYDLT
jgi:hypothetical protein